MLRADRCAPSARHVVPSSRGAVSNLRGRLSGAERPARQYHLYPNGVGIAVHEWGDENAPPLLLVHGGMDFARTYDVFAPTLAAAGWRVVGWDARGHGDSAHVELYSWDADMRDALAVFDHVRRVARYP